MTGIYEYLTQGAETTTVGVLLGMAASKLGTCDASVSKILCLHIPSLLPPPFTEMDVSRVAQIAAPSTPPVVLGLVVLHPLLRSQGKSGAAAGLQDLKIEERLGQYLTGGQEPSGRGSADPGEAARR